MVKKKKIVKQQVKAPKSQDEIDRAFIQQFKAMVRSVPLGPGTVLVHMLCDALDRLRV
jgi:hypothetical protein